MITAFGFAAINTSFIELIKPQYQNQSSKTRGTKKLLSFQLGGNLSFEILCISFISH
jgi:hypothetical protein